MASRQAAFCCLLKQQLVASFSFSSWSTALWVFVQGSDWGQEGTGAIWDRHTGELRSTPHFTVEGVSTKVPSQFSLLPLDLLSEVLSSRRPRKCSHGPEIRRQAFPKIHSQLLDSESVLFSCLEAVSFSVNSFQPLPWGKSLVWLGHSPHPFLLYTRTSSSPRN